VLTLDVYSSYKPQAARDAAAEADAYCLNQYQPTHSMGGVRIAAAALKTPTRNGYNARGVNLKG